MVPRAPLRLTALALAALVPAACVAEPPEACDPGAGGPHWILEGEPIAVDVGCATGLLVAPHAFEVVDLPRGATYNADTGLLEWTPALDQAAVYDLVIAVPTLGEVGQVRIGVADAWDHPDNVPILDPTRYTEEYGVPVFHLFPDDPLSPDGYGPATIVYRGRVILAEAKFRGASSLSYPQRSFTLKFASDDRFHEPDQAGGFFHKRKVVLTTTFDDNTFVRQRLGFELWNRLDPDHIQIQHYSAAVFLDGEYLGLYAVTDHVNRHLMGAHRLSSAGNLYKARSHDANFRLTRSDGSEKSPLHLGFEKMEGSPEHGEPGAYEDLDALTTFVGSAADADFAAGIGSLIDRRDYENWWIWVSLIEAGDSAGKNSYHYRDPDGGPWRFIPWDLNHSFGQDWRTLRLGPGGDPEGYVWANGIFERLLADPALAPPLRARYREVLDTELDLASVLEVYEEMVASTDLAARRSEARWQEEYRSFFRWSERRDFESYDGEVRYVREWIADRWASLGARY